MQQSKLSGFFKPGPEVVRGGDSTLTRPLMVDSNTSVEQYAAVFFNISSASTSTTQAKPSAPVACPPAASAPMEVQKSEETLPSSTADCDDGAQEDYGDDDDDDEPIWDDCNDVRRKIRAHLAAGNKITHFLREIGGINSNSFTAASWL